MYIPTGFDMPPSRILGSINRQNPRSEFLYTFTGRLGNILATRGVFLPYDRADIDSDDTKPRYLSGMDIILDQDAMRSYPRVNAVLNPRQVSELARSMNSSIEALPETGQRELIKKLFYKVEHGDLLIENVQGSGVYRMELVDYYSDEEEKEGIQYHLEFAVDFDAPASWYLNFTDDSKERIFSYLNVENPVAEESLNVIKGLIPNIDIDNPDGSLPEGKLKVCRKMYQGITIDYEYNKLYEKIEEASGVVTTLYSSVMGGDEKCDIYYLTASPD